MKYLLKLAACASITTSLLGSPLAHAEVQTFMSAAAPGSMAEFFRIQVTRECSDLKNEPYVKCTKQSITAADKSGKIIAKFDDRLIPRAADGTYKANLADIMLVDKDDGGGDGTWYFYLRFVPQEEKDIVFVGNGNQIWPNFFEVITDASLKPLKGMRLAQGSAASNWLVKMRTSQAAKLKKGEVDEDLRVSNYLEVMPVR